MSYVETLDLTIEPGSLQRIRREDYDLFPFDLSTSSTVYSGDIKWVRTHLRRLGLGLYRHESGVHLAGFTNGKAQHREDRWVFATEKPVKRFSVLGLNNRWLQVGTPMGIQRDPKIQLKSGNMTELLDRLSLDCTMIRHEEQATGERFPLRSHEEILRGLQLLHYTGPALNRYKLSRTLPSGLDYNQAHLMLHEWHSWLARNPEFKDMPRELALRMHGFGPLLDGGYPLV
jgi:hypothetical protein